MNIFQIIFLDVVLLIFPILVYLLYLTTNKNITNKSKKLYLSLVLITSFFMLYNYGVDTPRLLPVLILNSIVILSYLEDRYIIANILSILIIFIYSNFLRTNKKELLQFMQQLLNTTRFTYRRWRASPPGCWVRRRR